MEHQFGMSRLNAWHEPVQYINHSSCLSCWYDLLFIILFFPPPSLLSSPTTMYRLFMTHWFDEHGGKKENMEYEVYGWWMKQGSWHSRYAIEMCWHRQSNINNTSKALSTLSQKSATVAEFGDSRTFLQQSDFCETVSLFCDSVDTA